MLLIRELRQTEIEWAHVIDGRFCKSTVFEANSPSSVHSIYLSKYYAMTNIVYPRPNFWLCSRQEGTARTGDGEGMMDSSLSERRKNGYKTPGDRQSTCERLGQEVNQCLKSSHLRSHPSPSYQSHPSPYRLRVL